MEKKNYTVVYREDKLDKFVKQCSEKNISRLLKGYGYVMSGEKMKGKNMIDDVLIENKVAHNLPTGIRIHEPNICGFIRVLETIELLA